MRPRPTIPTFISFLLEGRGEPPRRGLCAAPWLYDRK
jgi:hypothetical protein